MLKTEMEIKKIKQNNQNAMHIYKIESTYCMINSKILNNDSYIAAAVKICLQKSWITP